LRGYACGGVLRRERKPDRASQRPQLCHNRPLALFQTKKGFHSL
jgi:hypothetical protein